MLYNIWYYSNKTDFEFEMEVEADITYEKSEYIDGYLLYPSYWNISLKEVILLIYSGYTRKLKCKKQLDISKLDIEQIQNKIENQLRSKNE